jgi:hypothetical protein
MDADRAKGGEMARTNAALAIKTGAALPLRPRITGGSPSISVATIMCPPQRDCIRGDLQHHRLKGRCDLAEQHVARIVADG